MYVCMYIYIYIYYIYIYIYIERERDIIYSVVIGGPLPVGVLAPGVRPLPGAAADHRRD